MTYIPFFEPFEASIARAGITKKPIIAISGLSGSGKGTYSKLLQRDLKEKYSLRLEIHESGEYFRRIAESYGYPESELYRFSEARQKDPKLRKEVDIRLDTDMLNTALRKGGIIVGRLTFALVGERGFKIWIDCDSRIAAERISLDKGRKEYGKPVEDIEAGLMRRDDADVRTYEELYGINYFGLLRHCNLRLDNSSGGKEENAKKILDGIAPWLRSFKYI